MNSRLIIIEGIAGSGKTTLLNELTDDFLKRGFKVFFVNDIETFSWKFMTLNKIESIRIELLLSLLEKIESMLHDEKMIVILDRFHITFALYSKYNRKVERKYDLLISKLKKMKPLLLIGFLNENKITKRVVHKERKDPTWNMWLELKKKLFGFDNLKDLYIEEQKKVFKIAKAQGIPYNKFYFERNGFRIGNKPFSVWKREFFA